MTVPGQRGVALGIVLWFLAGMSLLVSGIVYQARIDTRMAQLHLARATTVSAGDGAILLMLADLVSRNPEQSSKIGPISGSFVMGQQTVSVSMVPAAGLVNLNGASGGTLARLFAMRGQLNNAEAKTLADNMIKWRGKPGGSGVNEPGGKFQSPEDVLQVAGITRPLWDAIRDTVVVDNKLFTAEPDLAVAPDAVRAIFGASATGPRLVANGTGQRQAEAGLAGSYRVDAVVSYGGRSWLRRKWVDMGSNSTTLLPWSFTRVEAPRVLPGN